MKVSSLIAFLILFSCAKAQDSLEWNNRKDTLYTPVATNDTLLSAREAVDIALRENLRIEIARSDQQIADINNNWGNSGRWPTVNANVGMTQALSSLNQKLSNGTEISRNGATNNIINANLQASWRIYNGQRIRATKERFEELEAMGDIALQEEITRVSYDVLIAYYNLERLMQQVRAINAIIDLSKERLNIAQTRFNVGSAPKTDMLQAQIDLNAQQVSLQNLQAQMKNTKATLNNLLRRDPATPLSPSDTGFSIQPVRLLEFKQKIDTQNYQLLLAQKQRNLLVQDRRIINSQRLPVLSLNSNTSYNRNVASAGLFLTNQTYGPNIGLGLGIPIYNSNIFKTQLRANTVQQRQQQIRVDLLKTEIERDMQIAFQEYQNALTIVEIEQRNVKLAEENNFISSERFKKLQGNSIELRQAQLSLIEAQDRLINASFRAKIAETTIRFLAGEVYVSE